MAKSKQRWFRRRLVSLFDRLPWLGARRRELIEEGLWSRKRILFVNWIFQRILGVNGEVPWSVHFTSRVNAHRKISLGKGVKRSFAFSNGCYFQGLNGIVIGEGTLFGPGVRMLSANHAFADINKTAPPIEIGAHCWLGANVIILPGVVLGDHTVVGAGAVVTKSFPEGHVVLAGVPAKVLRQLPADLES